MTRAAALCLIPMLILGACANPEFQPYSGPGAVKVGTGGVTRTVKGMAVWDGSPPRRYEILGVIQEEGGGRADTETVLSDIVPVAKRHGADALILLETSRGITGINLSYGNFLSRPTVKTAVIRYLP